MILLREIHEKDLPSLEQFSDIPGFINIPDDDEILKDKIQQSVKSFSKQQKPNKGKYIFVAEDLDSKKIVGTSMIAEQHGTEESPHFYFEVDVEKKFSKTINTGFLHGTLKLKTMTDGPTEIGGLVLDPEYRKHPSKIGRQLSFVRFLYMALNLANFKEKVIAELLPPLNKKGQSPLWEAIGRRFTNMDYWEADRLCQKNKEFIFDLFPKGKIYTTFLPAEARNSIGKVSKDTEPVVHLLTRIGFKYVQQVDPFDGGPHLWADAKDIEPVQKLQKPKWSSAANTGSSEPYLITRLKPLHPFRAISLEGRVESGKFIPIVAEADLLKIEKALEIHEGEEIAIIPYN